MTLSFICLLTNFWIDFIARSCSTLFPAANVFTRSLEELYGNYWIAPTHQTGFFMLDLGCVIESNKVELVNSHNNGNRNGATKEFKVSVSKDKSDWEEIIHTTLGDARNMPDPLPIRQFTFNKTQMRYVQFDLLSNHGVIGGLQYFSVGEIKCISCVDCKVIVGNIC